MPRLKEAIRGIQDASLLRGRVSETPKVVTALAGLGGGSGGDGPREGKDYDRIARELMTKLLCREALSASELRDAAWCMWTTEPSLASTADVFGRVLNQMEASERRKPARSLAASYMASFGSERPGIDRVAGVLKRLSPTIGQPWTDLDESFSIFSLLSGPTAVARAALRRRVPPSDVLREGGLGSFDAQSGFAQAASAEALREIAETGIGHEDRLQFVRLIGLKSERELQFADQAPLVADALTRPFTSAMPEKAIRDKYLSLLLGLFGDPRLNPGSWTRMPQAEAIVRKWLTEQSLRQFLDIVDRVAPVKKWKYRRAFWECVYNSGIVEEAWVVFEHACAGEARRAYGSIISFGRFNSRGIKTIQNGHAVLLMRVGRSLIADWSHDGRCNIWDDAEARTAPRLNKAEYSSDEVQHPSMGMNITSGPYFSISHNSPQTYTWQRVVAAKLKNLTGVNVLEGSYRVE
jgi:hypothetical protein